MSEENVNPGEGYRLLSVGERIESGDEAFEGGDWWEPRTSTVGDFLKSHWRATRRKIMTPVDWNKPLETAFGVPARVVCSLDRSTDPYRHGIAYRDSVTGEENICAVDDFGNSHTGAKGFIRNKQAKPLPNGWRSVDCPPDNSNTVLLTSCDEQQLRKGTVTPLTHAEYVWTGFFPYDTAKRDDTPAKFWRPLY